MFVTSVWGTKTSDQIWALRERSGIYSEKEIPGKLTMKLRWEGVVARQHVGEEGYSRERKRFIWRKWSRGGTWYVGTRPLGQVCPEWVGKETQGWEWEARPYGVLEWGVLPVMACPSARTPSRLRHVPHPLLTMTRPGLVCATYLRKWEAIKLSKIYCHVVWALKCLPQKLQF